MASTLLILLLIGLILEFVLMRLVERNLNLGLRVGEALANEAIKATNATKRVTKENQPYSKILNNSTSIFSTDNLIFLSIKLFVKLTLSIFIVKMSLYSCWE
jgi:hypothetical protein